MTVYVWKDVSKHPDVIRLELTEAVTTIDIAPNTTVEVEEEPK